MAQSRGRPAWRGLVRKPRRRSRWESRPGWAALAGFLLVAVAVGVTVITDGGGDPVATPTDTALPSRPAAGPDPGDGTPNEEEDLALPEDDVDPRDEFDDDEPDQRKAPQPRRPAPARKAPGDASKNAPPKKSVNQPMSKPVDVPEDDWDAVQRGVPFASPEPPEKAVPVEDDVVFATRPADATPFAANTLAVTVADTVPAKDDSFRPRHRWHHFRHWHGDTTWGAGDRAIATPHRHGRPWHCPSGFRSPVVKGDDRHGGPTKARGLATTRTFDRHGVRDTRDQFSAKWSAHVPKHLMKHAGGDSFVHAPSAEHPRSDGHHAGPSTYLGP